MPYRGPASTNGSIGKTEAAYFKMINDQGGINACNIEFVSLDDDYSPPEIVETAQRPVAQDELLQIFNSLGTPPIQQSTSI
jgi:ABC-type branched-subunit amino acid transport system substrate-binding protein